MASQVTQLLESWRNGNEEALNTLMPLVYGELRRIAQRCMYHGGQGQTLQPTAVVNEAYLKLIGSGRPEFANRSHFLAVMARAMRQILIDHARANASLKRGGEEQRVTWDAAVELESGEDPRQVRILEIDMALQTLAKEDQYLAGLLEMHYFAGMTAEEVAETVGRSAHAVRHDLRLARAWLRRKLA